MQQRWTYLLFFFVFSFCCVVVQADNNTFNNTFNLVQKHEKALSSSTSKTWESVELNCIVDVQRYYQQCAKENVGKNEEERKITRLYIEIPTLLTDLFRPFLSESGLLEPRLGNLFLQRVDSLYHKLFKKKLIEDNTGFREINYLKDFPQEEKIFLENFFHGALLLRRILFPSLKYEIDGKYHRIPRQQLSAVPEELWEKIQEQNREVLLAGIYELFNANNIYYEQSLKIILLQTLEVLFSEINSPLIQEVQQLINDPWNYEYQKTPAPFSYEYPQEILIPTITENEECENFLLSSSSEHESPRSLPRKTPQEVIVVAESSVVPSSKPSLHWGIKKQYNFIGLYGVQPSPRAQGFFKKMSKEPQKQLPGEMDLGLELSRETGIDLKALHKEWYKKHPENIPLNIGFSAALNNFIVQRQRYPHTGLYGFPRSYNPDEPLGVIINTHYDPHATFPRPRRWFADYWWEPSEGGVHATPSYVWNNLKALMSSEETTNPE